MMTATKIDPLYSGNQISKMLLYRNKSGLQIVGILLSEGMEMKTIQ